MKKKFSFKTITVMLSLIIACSLLLSGCNKKVEKADGKYKISIAEQYGLAYAPLQIMKEKKLLEKNLPGIEVSWSQLGNTAAIREAMLANKLDVGFMALPPFLIGWSNGMDWKIASALSSSPVGLVTNSENIKSIKDFTEKDRIAVPQPGSVQHILLSMAAEKEFGDSHKLDNKLVTMAHPDGMNALLSKKDVTAHFTSPPYLFEELENKAMKEILTGEEALGSEFTFIAGVTTKKFHDNNPEIYSAFVKALHESMDFITNNPKEASKILAPIYKLSEEKTLKYLTAPGTEYSKEVKGILQFAEFMKKNNYINKIPNFNDILWEDVKYEK